MNILKKDSLVWAEINLDNLVHNVGQIKKYVGEDTLVTAVVKANGYGHGSRKIARTFLDSGADRLAVANLIEAIELRESGIVEPVLILGYTLVSQYESLIEYNLIPTIYIYEEAKSLSDKAVELNKRVNIHIKLDSGMGRIGFLINDESIEDIIKISKLPNIYIEGIYTHFAKADELDKLYTRVQFKRYIDFIKLLSERGLDIPIKHASNSAGIIEFPEFNLNMVRAGSIIYGFYPSREVCRRTIKLKPAMTLKARITNLKIVGKSVGISYGQKFITERESKIATLPIGYADGFSRILSSNAEVCINGYRANVVGTVCMDQCMVDVTHIEDVKIGDEVIIFGYEKEEYPSVDELAEKLGTIHYEVICMIGNRVPRIYTSSLDREE